MSGPSELDKFSQSERKTKALERIADALNPERKDWENDGDPCNDCGQPARYVPDTGWYEHINPDAPACFLMGSAGGGSNDDAEERGLALAGMKAHLETIVATLPEDEKSFAGVMFTVLVGGYDVSIERSDEDGGSIDRLPIRNRREALQVIEGLLWAIEQEEGR